MALLISARHPIGSRVLGGAFRRAPELLLAPMLENEAARDAAPRMKLSVISSESEEGSSGELQVLGFVEDLLRIVFQDVR